MAGTPHVLRDTPGLWCVGTCTDGEETTMGGRKKTQGDTPDWGLTPQQCTAVDLLVSGKTLSQTAEALGVGRPAVSDWVNHHCGFQAALNSRRQELFDGIVDE